MGSTGAARAMSTGTTVGGNVRPEPDTLVDYKVDVIQSFDIVDVPVYDKYGDQIETHRGFANSAGRLMFVVSEGRGSYTLQMGDIQSGFVAATYGLSEEEAWKRLWRGLNS